MRHSLSTKSVKVESERMQQVEEVGANSTIECSHMHRLSALFMRHTTSLILLVQVKFETSTTCQSESAEAVRLGDALAVPVPVPMPKSMPKPLPI